VHRADVGAAVWFDRLRDDLQVACRRRLFEHGGNEAAARLAAIKAVWGKAG
jgi:hypothetical protein